MAGKIVPHAKIVARRERCKKRARELRDRGYSFAQIGKMLRPPMTRQGVHRMLAADAGER